MNLAALTEAVSAFYSSDRVRAGVVVSQLGSRSWYVSCARYPSDHLSKKIICSANGETFDEAVTACTLAWLIVQGRTRHLSDQLGLRPKALGAYARRSL